MATKGVPRKPLSYKDKQRLYSQLSPDQRIACGIGGRAPSRKSTHNARTKQLDEQEKLMFSIMQQHKSAQEKVQNKAQHKKTRAATNSNRKRRKKMKIPTKITTPLEDVSKIGNKTQLISPTFLIFLPFRLPNKMTTESHYIL